MTHTKPDTRTKRHKTHKTDNQTDKQQKPKQKPWVNTGAREGQAVLTHRSCYPYNKIATRSHMSPAAIERGVM